MTRGISISTTPAIRQRTITNGHRPLTTLRTFIRLRRSRQIRFTSLSRTRVNHPNFPRRTIRLLNILNIRRRIRHSLFTSLHRHPTRFRVTRIYTSRRLPTATTRLDTRRHQISSFSLLSTRLTIPRIRLIRRQVNRHRRLTRRTPIHQARLHTDTPINRTLLMLPNTFAHTTTRRRGMRRSTMRRQTRRPSTGSFNTSNNRFRRPRATTLLTINPILFVNVNNRIHRHYREVDNTHDGVPGGDQIYVLRVEALS